MLGKRALLEAEPMLRSAGSGAARYSTTRSATTPGSTLATARSAIQHGALVANYMRGRRPGADRRPGRRARRWRTGSPAERGVIRAGVVVNATGPWGDRIRQMEDAGAAPLLRPTKGIHLVVDRGAGSTTATAIIFTSPIDGRVMFVLPWGDLSYIGTTDTDTDESARPAGDPAGRGGLPAPLRQRPVPQCPAHRRGRPGRLGRPPAAGGYRTHRRRQAAARASTLIVQGSGGMITVAGGKLTTYRVDGARGGGPRGPGAPAARRPEPAGRGAHR